MGDESPPAPVDGREGAAASSLSSTDAGGSSLPIAGPPDRPGGYLISPRSFRADTALAYSSLMCLVQTLDPATLSSTVRPALFR